MKRVIQAVGTFRLVRVLNSSIGRKFVMAVTGLALCGFLVLHLSGNLLLYAGAQAYDHYAHTLHAQKLLLAVAEFGLLILFVGHIVLAFANNAENNAARPVGYAVTQSKMDQGPFVAPASSVMMGTGLVVLLFLLLHLADFTFSEWGIRSHEGDTPFSKAVAVLRDPLSAVVYVVGSVVLGYHLLHGFQSAFQSLGINHPGYTPLIRLLSLVFAVTVAAGFGSFPLWAWAIKS